MSPGGVGTGGGNAKDGGSGVEPRDWRQFTLLLSSMQIYELCVFSLGNISSEQHKMI